MSVHVVASLVPSPTLSTLQNLPFPAARFRLLFPFLISFRRCCPMEIIIVPLLILVVNALKDYSFL